MSEHDSDVVIVGGGIIGLACAFFLLDAGRSVRVLDMDQLGGGCSAGNCGLITPSHAAPLHAPGLPRTALRALFDPRAPLYVRPTWRTSTLGWLLRFALHCNARHVQHATAARAALLNSSRQLYDSIIDAHKLQCDWEAQGVLAVYRDARTMEAHAEEDARLARFGIVSTAYRGEELLELEPALRDGLHGGHLYEMDAQVRPERLIAEMARAVRANGAHIEEGCALEGFVTHGNVIDSLRTSRGSRRAREYVLALGTWTPEVARQLELRLPIEPGKGYSITVSDDTDPSHAQTPRRACILQERSVAVTPWAGGYRLGGTMEFAGYDSRLSGARIQAILAGASEYLRAVPTDTAKAQLWYGWRPMSPDEMPFIGRSPRHTNVTIAAGHGMMGVSMAPATGKLVTEITTGATPHVDPTPYRVDRFGA